MKKALKLSPWFSGAKKPWQPGVYETCGNPGDRILYARRWDGQRWSNCCNTKLSAAKATTRTAWWRTRPNYWRGLAVDPAVQS